MKKCAVCIALALMVCLIQAVHAVPDEKTAEKSLTIINNESYPIGWVYITPWGSSAWGEDWVGTNPIQPGEQRTWTIPAWDGCYIDFQATAFGGTKVEQRMADVCGGSVWTLSDPSN
jgi:hypothetical protein